MKFVSLHAMLFELKIHKHTALGRHTVVSGVSEETRRSFCGYLDLGKKLVTFFSIHEIRWVNENTEVRTARQIIGGVDFG